MARRKLQSTVREQLQRAIQKSDLSIYALARLTGISHQQIGRFAKGERGLTLGSFTAIAAALGMQLVPEDVAPVVEILQSPAGATDVTTIDEDVLVAVRRNTKPMKPAKLADVFKALQVQRPGLTIGILHDALRRLQAAGKIELQPWTGAMYSLKDGEACLILGTEIMSHVAAK